MKFIRTLAFLLITIIISLSFCGCGDDYKEAYIYFELSEYPSTLDAQTASTDSELLIVRNIYEGLLRKNSSGAISNGVAESYEKNGLTYTFRLREDAKWSTGEKLLADDFVFAFKRAVSPATKAPFASRLFCIANAKAINEGTADISTLGVTASDSRTLVITLSTEDPNFEETLTTSICMPCNEDFFNECVGKYGLESKYTISNGSYSLTKWAKDPFGIRIYRNKQYSGGFEASNAAVFISCNDEETPLSLLKEENIDLGFIDCSERDSAKDSGFELIEYQNICWVLSIGTQYDANIRRCFAKSFSPNVYSSALPSGFEAATSLYPDILGTSTDGVGVTAYDIASAKSTFSDIVSGLENKKFPSSTLYYYDHPGIKQTATAVVGHWQQNLSAFINIESSDSLDALQSELKTKSLSFSIFPIYARSASVAEYLRNFGITSADATAVQTQLLKDNTLIPLAFSNTSIAYRKAITEIYSEGANGYIDFAYIIKEE